MTMATDTVINQCVHIKACHAYSESIDDQK